MRTSTRYARYCSSLSDGPDGGGTIGRESWEELVEEHDGYIGCNEVPSWTKQMMVQIGAALVDVALGSLSTKHFGKDFDVEAFFHSYEFVGGKVHGIVAAHPSICKPSVAPKNGKAEVNMPLTKPIEATALPMLSPPKPWRSVKDGPFLVTPANLVRCGHDAYQHLSLLTKTQGNMSEVFDALNHLGTTPWRINKAVLEALLPLHYSEKGFPDLLVPPLTIPSVPAVPLSELRSLPPRKRREYEQARQAAKKLKMENLGLRADLDTKIAISKLYQDAVFYLPHNLDFRGRAYVVCSLEKIRAQPYFRVFFRSLLLTLVFF